MTDVHVYLFQRDLRCEHHLALEQCSQKGGIICPVFIFDPRQLSQHEYKSTNGLHFLMDACEDLDACLKKRGSNLTVLKGRPAEALAELKKTLDFKSITWALDVTPFSKQKSEEIQAWCQNHDVEAHQIDHLFLRPIASVHKDDGRPYTVFTPYFKKSQQAQLHPLGKLKRNTAFYQSPEKKPWLGLEPHIWKAFRPTTPKPALTGGRSAGLKALKSKPPLDAIQHQHDFPSVRGSSQLSAHLKFGTLSPIEVLNAFETEMAGHPLSRQLHWRDFLSQIAHQFPRVFSENFQIKTQHIVWPNPDDHLKLWQEGTTGFPIVDAGMRELVQSGNMHNRVRMICASFLVKDLHVDWRKGEQFFARHLTDYDPALNNGNWQWAASTGCDAQPYFRIFNPWLQQKKFDVDATYIKTWIPELAHAPAKAIHQHERKPATFDYPTPLIDHKTASTVAKSLFASS